ncbi:MAG: hypothetical protein FWG63_02525 [Defluviitaleaceae bacterium]|nr:hypothetical protein [Defluviitaleaceae bacterium]
MEYIKANEYDIYFTVNINGSVIDITELTTSITYKTEWFTGAAGRLTATLVNDPYDPIFEIPPGSQVVLMINDTGVFKGYAFKVEVDERDEFKITAYDQMIYLRFEDTIYTPADTASNIFANIAGRQGANFKIRTASSHMVKEYRHKGETFYNMIKNSIIPTNMAENKQYFIRDEFGTLVFCELSNNLTDVVIGYKELATAFVYGQSISDGTYNFVKVVQDNEETGQMDMWIKYDSSTIEKWGRLPKLVEADKEKTEAEIIALAQNLLNFHNTPRRKIKITALGLIGLQAADGIRIYLPRHEIDHKVWLKTVTHNFTPNDHTMDLELFIRDIEV